MQHPLLELLDQRVAIGDGAMGTMLYSAGIPFDECFDVVSLSEPNLVGSVHRAYIDAGADIIETNTYGANRLKLHQFGLQEDVRKINRASARIAREQREISGKPVLVAGSVGPTGAQLEPIGRTASQLAFEAFREQFDALLEAGVDFFTIETMPTLQEMRLAVEAAQGCSDLPIVAMMTFAEDGLSVGGDEPATVARELAQLGVEVIGANCSVGPQRLLRVMRQMRSSLDQVDEPPYLACQPNAGWPTQVAGRVHYPSSPEYFGTFARSAADMGVSLIGGCCGTTPQHTAAMVEEIATEALGSGGATVTRRPEIRPIPQPIADQPEAAWCESAFRKALDRRFVVSVEIDPPKGLNQEKAIVGAQLLKDAGVDAINVADSPMARVRMSALTLCYLIRSEVDVETIVHFTTRDRSLMGIQSELLGAHAAGVRTILALTGDPPTLGEYPGTSGVFDINSIGLIRLLSNMNQGLDATGASIGTRANFHIGCAVDPTRADLVLEASRLREKLDAGAHFVMTQPIYHLNVWTRFLDVFGGEIPVPVLIGILPLQSSRHAEFLHNEVPGITLTADARKRMKDAGSEGRAEGVSMAQELLISLKPWAQGVYLMPSFGRYEVAAQVLEVLEPEKITQTLS